MYSKIILNNIYDIYTLIISTQVIKPQAHAKSAHTISFYCAHYVSYE